MDKKEIAQLRFSGTKPTTHNLKLLQEWVIWQFPKKMADGFCGAVHPPLEKYGWFPALIHPDKNEIQIYGHLPEAFDTPELAADYFVVNGKQ